MKTKLVGHTYQAAGYTLVFLGLGVAAAAMFLATTMPSVSFWVFAAAAVAIGAPLMVAGGRVNAVGRGMVLGRPSEDAARGYRRGTALLGVYLALLLLQGAWVAAPLALVAAGAVDPMDPLVSAWVVTWTFAFCVGRYWITRPLVCAAERRLRR
jgi:hypothetical protein